MSGEKRYPLPINLFQNEIKNALFHNLSTPPSNPKIGQYYYDTNDALPYFWNGLTWEGFGAAGVESVTSTDNHIVVDNTDPSNPTLSFQLVDNENLLTDDELAIVQATSGTNTGDQVADQVTITGTGSLLDPFVAPPEVAVSDTEPINGEKIWINPSESGMQIYTKAEVDLLIAGVQPLARLVLQDTKNDTNNLTGMAIKEIANNATKIATCYSGTTIIRALNSNAIVATLTTANSRLITYCSSIDEFHVICNLAGIIYRIGGTSNALIGTISVTAQTVSDRTAFDSLGNFEYYTSGASGVTLNQRNLTDGTVATVTVGSGISAIKCFTQGGVNYIAVLQGYSINIYNESLTFISTVGIASVSGITLCYNANKLYASGSIYNFGTSIIDTSTISSLTVVENLIGCWKVKCTPNYLITETQGFNIQSVGSKNYTLRLHNYSDLQAIDSKYLFPTNYFAVQGLEYDAINDIVISMSVSGSSTYYSSLFYLKIK